MAKTWQVVLATIAIFVAGLVTGGATALGVAKYAGDRRSRNNPAQAQQGGNRGPLGLGFGPQLLRTFANELNLSDDQRAQIAPILKRTVFDLGQERHEVQLKSALIIERMQDDISGILTPEQRTRFDELIARQRERMRRFRTGEGQPKPQGQPN
jgi:Spy/CpxP family protein refolding chaperone